MPVRLVIDGYNLVRADSAEADYVHNDLEGARSRLIDRLKIYKRLKHGRLTLVFDGTASGRLSSGKENHAGVEVLFSKGGEDADTVIKRLVREKGASLTVVTSDHALGSYVETHGAVVISSAEFLDILDMAEYEDVKGVSPEDEEGEEPGFGKKKGPSRRPAKQARKKRNRLKKL
jgi:hypothetical protein